MSPNIRLIITGFGFAGLGSGATMFLIVGLSDLFVGRYRFGVALLAVSAVGFVLFQWRIGSYLDKLEQRFDPVNDPDNKRPD